MITMMSTNFAEDDEDDDNGAGWVVTGACDTY